MDALPPARVIADAQMRWTTDWHQAPTPVPEGGLLRLACENHRRNFDLWHEEDIARRDDLGPEAVLKSKRAIDRHNQQRNDFIEQMDKALVATLQPDEGAPPNSETPGMIIDRLSILALKEFHMEEQTRRDDATDEHRTNCARKLAVLRRQRADLAEILQTLIDEVRAGRRSFRVYYQFKMYNDPSLNPQLYTKQQG